MLFEMFAMVSSNAAFRFAKSAFRWSMLAKMVAMSLDGTAALSFGGVVGAAQTQGKRWEGQRIPSSAPHAATLRHSRGSFTRMKTWGAVPAGVRMVIKPSSAVAASSSASVGE